MSELEDRQFKSEVKRGNTLCSEGMTMPVWEFRYRLAGNRSVISLGSYSDCHFSDARKHAK